MQFLTKRTSSADSLILDQRSEEALRKVAPNNFSLIMTGLRKTMANLKFLYFVRSNMALLTDKV